jgi:hypothetical protein
MSSRSRLIVVGSFILLFINVCSAQNNDKSLHNDFTLGLEIQAYPTGVIPGIRLEKFINGSTSLSLRLGYQIIDHRDLGVQENEEGSGYGASFAYRKFFNSQQKGFSLALRSDIWRNKIDWQTGSDFGTSNITVVQPTLMGEYTFKSNTNFSITPSFSFGWEWNVSTDGEATGEGAIILLGCSFGLSL